MLLLVGVVASAGLLVGFDPARLPPALTKIAAYKLTFVAALGLFAAGATFLRRARREETHNRSATLAPQSSAKALADGQAPAPAPTTNGRPEAARAARVTETGGG